MLIFIYMYYYYGAVDMQICAPLTRSQCKVSDTQVTVRPVGLLFQFLRNTVCPLQCTLMDIILNYRWTILFTYIYFKKNSQEKFVLWIEQTKLVWFNVNRCIFHVFTKTKGERKRYLIKWERGFLGERERGERERE